MYDKIRIYIRKYSERLAVETYQDGELDYYLSHPNVSDEAVDNAIKELKQEFGEDVYIRDERSNASGN